MDPAITAALIGAVALVVGPSLAVILRHYLSRLEGGDGGDNVVNLPQPPAQEKSWLIHARHRTVTWLRSFVNFFKNSILPWLTPVVWFLGLSMLFYIFATLIFLFMPGSLSLQVPADVYIREVPAGETAIAEATVVVRDLSRRGWFFRHLSPMFLTLGQLKIAPQEEGGRIQIAEQSGTSSVDPTNSFILKKYPGPTSTIRYFFRKGQDVGHIQLSLYDFRDNPDRDIAIKTKLVRFVKIP